MRRSLLMALLWITPDPALAAVEDDPGVGSRASAMGGAFSAVADDVSAIYHNPAALTALAARERGDGKRSGLLAHVGLLHATPRLWISPGSAQAGGVKFDAPKDHEAPDISGFSLGMVLDLQPHIGLPAALGLLLYMPTQRILYWQTPTAEELQWPMYDDRTQHLSILPALSIALPANLHLGIGLRILPEARTNTVVLTTWLEADSITSGEDATLSMQAAPTAALYWEPSERLRVGLVFREALYMDDHGQTDITGLVPSAYIHHLAHYYLPRQWVLAGAFSPAEGTLLSVQLDWMQWSDYLDAYHQRHGEERFQDQWRARVGASQRLFGSTSLMLGYAYVPSPLRDGQVWTNFIDNDKHILSIGSSTRLHRQFTKKRSPIDLSWHLQLHLLRERHYVKYENEFGSEAAWAANPGTPGFASGGYMISLGVSLDIGL